MTIYYTAPGATGNGLAITTPGSIATCEGLCNPGDSVEFADGTYSTNQVRTITKSGSSGLPITYYARNKWAALIQWTSTSRGQMWTLDNNATGYAGGISYRVFDGFKADGRTNGTGTALMGNFISCSAFCHHITTKNCYIQYTGAAGISYHSCDYCYAFNNYVYRWGNDVGNQTSGGWSSAINYHYAAGIAKLDTGAGFHHVAANNILCGGFDSSVNHSDGNGIIIDCPVGTYSYADAPSHLFVNNLCVQIGGRGIHNLDSNFCWVVNNTAYACGNDTTMNNPPPNFNTRNGTNCAFINNVSYASVPGRNYQFTGTTGDCIYRANIRFAGIGETGVPSADLTDPTHINNVDPKFKGTLPSNAADIWQTAMRPEDVSDIFTLQSTSPALGTGVDPRALTSVQAMKDDLHTYLQTDIVGATRPGV